jgi:CubicO group peptidase (beta-lactamase class C family)
MLVGMALERATGRRVSDLLAELWQQVGAEYPASWNLDSQASGFEKMESGINAVPIDFLRLGALVLNGGRLPDGTPILPAGWTETITSPTSDLGDGAFYGLFWWGFALPDGARDAYAGGIFGQVLYVAPRKDAVILRTGTSDAGVDGWPLLLQKLATALPP